MMDKKIDIYLAVPYTHDDKKVREKRFYEVTKMAAQLTKLGYVVYSPITHCHPMATIKKLPGSWEFWGPIDKAFMDCCKIVAIYELDGWTSSVGIAAEFRHARGNNQPIMSFRSLYDFKRNIDSKMIEYHESQM
jgi:hypothetical protein